MKTQSISPRGFLIAAAVPVILTACSDLPTAAPPFEAASPAIVLAPESPSTMSDVSLVTITAAGKFGTLYYGKWCGPGWSGGSTGSEAPIDYMDVYCRTHDRAYASADAYWKPKYQGTTNTTLKNSYCTSWRQAYKNADNKLASNAGYLPSKSTLNTSVTRGDTPDAWGYDKRIYGTHPWNAYERGDYALRVRMANILGLFKNPVCTTT